MRIQASQPAPETRPQAPRPPLRLIWPPRAFEPDPELFRLLAACVGVRQSIKALLERWGA